MSSRDVKASKTATVAYLIDSLGMRVGDEKDEDEADTVGATTLRVEHIKIFEDRIEFDFLGKDSVRWMKTISTPDEVLLRNLRRFTKGKDPQDEVFDIVTSRDVNRFLSSIVPGLTVKVFRTYHATKVAKENLRSKDMRQAERAREALFCEGG